MNLLWFVERSNIMNIVFWGSDDFAAVHLEALINSSHTIVACVTRPDRPKGRGMKVIVSDVKQCALDHNVPVFQPTTLKMDAFTKKLKECKSDLFIVIAYGQFLPKAVLDISPLGAINVHGSLLPRYRGAAPINWAIINGEEESGLSIIRVNERMDAGDILSELPIAIMPKDTSVTLRAKMMAAGPGLLLKTINGLASDPRKWGGAPQNKDEATLAPKLTKDIGTISWDKPAVVIHNLVRGLLPWPGAYTFYEGELLKVLRTEILEENFQGRAPGTVVGIDKEGISVSTGDGGVLIKEVHLQGAKAMDAYSFIVGHKICEGYQFKGQSCRN